MCWRNTFGSVASLAMTCVAVAASAAPVFYISSLPDGVATPGVFVEGKGVFGSTGQLNIFANTDIRLGGISLNLTETGNAIKFTSLNVPNPVSAGQKRWAFLDGPQVIADTHLNSIGGAMFGFSGTGIGPGSLEAPSSSGYLLATVGYKVVDQFSSTDLFLSVGLNQIADTNGNAPAVVFGPGSPTTDGEAVAGTTDNNFDFRLSPYDPGIFLVVHPLDLVANQPGIVTGTVTASIVPLVWRDNLLNFHYVPDFGAPANSAGLNLQPLWNPATQQFS